MWYLVTLRERGGEREKGGEKGVVYKWNYPLEGGDLIIPYFLYENLKENWLLNF